MPPRKRQDKRRRSSADLEQARVRLIYELPYPWTPIDADLERALAGLYGAIRAELLDRGLLEVGADGGRRPLRSGGPTGSSPPFFHAAARFDPDPRIRRRALVAAVDCRRSMIARQIRLARWAARDGDSAAVAAHEGALLGLATAVAGDGLLVTEAHVADLEAKRALGARGPKRRAA
jgi:hypothetical protein